MCGEKLSVLGFCRNAYLDEREREREKILLEERNNIAERVCG